MLTILTLLWHCCFLSLCQYHWELNVNQAGKRKKRLSPQRLFFIPYKAEKALPGDNKSLPMHGWGCPYRPVFQPQHVTSDLNINCSIDTNNKNLETYIGVHPEDQKSKATSHCLLRLPQTKTKWDPVSSNPQTPYHTEFLSLPLYNPLSTQLYHSRLPLPTAEITFVWALFSFRQIQSCVAQGDLDLTEIHLPLSPKCLN